MKTKFYTLFCVTLSFFIFSQVGINTTDPKTTLQIDPKVSNTTPTVEGIIIPRLTGDEIFNMPMVDGDLMEANLVYATEEASTANQIDHGINLKGKGFFYWDEDVWRTIDNASVTTTVNNIWAQIKPMNFVYGDNNDFPEGGSIFTAPRHPDLKLLNVNFGNTIAGQDDDLIIENNPLPDPNNSAASFVMWNNTTKTIQIPSQLLGYAIGITLSLKYEPATANVEASRVAAYTGNIQTTASGLAVLPVVSTNPLDTVDKIKDLYFKRNTVDGTYVRDELIMNPIIVTQKIIDYGIKIFVGSGTNNKAHNYYEPVLTVNYGVVNTQQ